MKTAILMTIGLLATGWGQLWAGEIGGLAVKQGNDAPFAGVTVTLFRIAPGGETRVDSFVTTTTGRYQFPNLEAGKYKLVYAKPGFDVLVSPHEHELLSGTVEAPKVTVGPRVAFTPAIVATILQSRFSAPGAAREKDLKAVQQLFGDGFKGEVVARLNSGN